KAFALVIAQPEGRSPSALGGPNPTKGSANSVSVLMRRRISAATRLPLPSIGHRLPRLPGRQSGTLLQEFDGLPVGRAHERHYAVARRPVDGDASFHQTVAHRIDVVDLEGEMAEIARLAVVLGVPIIGEFEQWRVAASVRARFDQRPILWGGEE